MKISKHNKSTYVVVLTILLILSLTACAVDIPIEEFAPEVLPEITEKLPDENIQEDFIQEADDAPNESEDQQEAGIVDGYLEVHFIDVGQADAALVICNDRAMMIDGGNAEDSSLIYAYLQKHGITHLDYIINSHPHEDHVGGLAGALNYATAGKAFCPVTSYDSKAFSSFVKYLSAQGLSIIVPSVGDTFQLGAAFCTVLASGYSTSDPNDSSIVLRLVFGDVSFIFAGDAGEDVEKYIINSRAEIDSTVLKVAHHGSSKGTCYQWLYEVNPQYAVISVGADNSYGHPTEVTLSKLHDADVQLYRTDLQGDIIFTSDGKSISVSCEKNQDADTFAVQKQVTVPSVAPAVIVPDRSAAGNVQDYWVNTNTGKFHYPSCASAKKIKDTNLWIYNGSRDELISQGYVPCKNCNP